MYKNNIINDIKNCETIVISGHTNPDGDAVGATFAFAQAMKAMGKKPIILLEKYADKLNYIKGGEYVYRGNYDELNPEIFFALDCGDKSRLGEAEAVFERAKLTYNIDHHISNTNYGDINIVNGFASSASEIVYEILKDICAIDKDMAVAMYSGIIFDTGGFKHSSTSKRTHQIAGELLELGVDSADIHSKILYEHTLPQVKVFSKALDNMSIEDGIAYTTLSVEEIDNCNAEFSDLDGIVEYLLNIAGIDVSVLITQRSSDMVKISLRANSTDVNYVASKFGGGGHKLAAGASYSGTLQETIKLVLTEIKGNR